ncbi:MAG: hypothetical protein KC502_14015 [Myxococcales bacterium]|nr:hypothetical protein [Myxococcales bacterium]
MRRFITVSMAALLVLGCGEEGAAVKGKDVGSSVFGPDSGAQSLSDLGGGAAADSGAAGADTGPSGSDAGAATSDVAAPDTGALDTGAQTADSAGGAADSAAGSPDGGAIDAGPGGCGSCDDSDPCTTDGCTDGKCTHDLTVDGCRIDGACIAPKAKKAAGSCLVCKPSVSKVAWSATLAGGDCDDGDPCTVSDACVVENGVGICGSKPMDCTTLDGACTQGVCQKGACQVASKADGGSCNDGDACTDQDTCAGGQCSGKAKDCSGTADDCNDATCSQGVCSKKPKTTGSACSDGDPCTTGDACFGGVCSSKPMDCSGQAGPCVLAACKAGKCVKTNKPKGQACVDGNPCTTGDVCDAGGKCAGKAMNCSSKNGVCVVGVCAGGSCIAKNKPNGTACSDGESCTSNDKCTSGKCVGAATKDAYEPNGSAPGKLLGTKTDCEPPATFKAVISPKNELDWYYFKAQDKSFCTIQPEVKLTALAADMDVCIYFKCGNGKTGDKTVQCTQGKYDGGGPGGTAGCCSFNSGKIAEYAKIKPRCSTLGAGDESGTVYVRVRSKGGKSCGGYTLSWAAKK